MLTKKEQRLRRARQTRIRIANQGVARLMVNRTNLHIYASVISGCGTKVVATASTAEADVRKSIRPGGSVIHEVGGAIMGDDPRKSVTNQWGQTWDVKNLFLTDGAPFASNADKNPTLTIMALAWRACDHLLAEMKKGNL